MESNGADPVMPAFSRWSPTLAKPTGRSNDQFTPPRLFVTGGQWPLLQWIELILVAAPLKPEQQPVIALARRVDHLLVAKRDQIRTSLGSRRSPTRLA